MAKATVWWIFKRPLLRAAYVFIALSVILVCIAAVAGYAQSADLESVLIVIAFLLFLPSLFYASAWFRFRGLTQQQRSATWRFSDAQITVESALARSTLSWQAFQEARESRTAFLLFPYKALFHLIPKKAFSTPEDLHGFRQLLVAKLGKRARVAKTTRRIEP